MTVSRWPGPLKSLPPLLFGIATADRLTLGSAALFDPPRAGPLWLAGLLGLALLALVGLRLPPGRRFFIVLVLAGALLGGLPRALPLSARLSEAMATGRPVVVAARIEEVELRRDGRWRARLRVTACRQAGTWRHNGAGLLLTWPERLEEPRAGESIVARLQLEAIRGATNPGGFEARPRERRRGIDARARMKSPADLLARRPPPFVSLERALAGLRGEMGKAIDRRLDGFPRRFTRVLLLGDRVAFRPEEEADFRAAGVTHILSVSGLHVGLVAATVQLLSGRRRRPASLAISCAAIWGYTLLVGAPSAAVRSAVMLTLGLTARHLRRRLNGVTLLSGAVFVLLAGAPALLFDLGFDLSVASIAGLLLAHSLLESWRGLARWPPPLRAVVNVTALTLGAQAATAPMTIPLWGDWPLVAPLANLLVVGLSDLILTGGLLALALNLADPASADRVLAAVWGLSRLLGWMVHQLASHSPGVRGLLPPPGWVPAACLVSVILFALSRACGASRRLRLALAGSVLVSFAALVGWPESRPPGLRVTALDVGQGDALMLEFPDGRTLLIDGGEGGAGESGSRVVLPGLRAGGHRRFDAVVVSHAHHDHLGGLFAVLQSGRVRRLFDSGYGPPDGEIAAFRAEASRRNVPVCLVAAGDTLLSGPEYSVVALWPPRPADPTDDGNRPGGVLNDYSLVLDVRWRGRRLLLAGDLETAGERKLLPALAAGPVDLLKAGHHGSRTSSSEAWLDRLRPRHVVVSVGERNKFGHPAALVMARCRSRGVELHRTDEAGAWRLTWTGGAEPLHESWGDGRRRPPERHLSCAGQRLP